MKKSLLLLIPSMFLVASCGESEKPQDHVHTYSTNWSANDTQHWHAATCEHADLQSELGDHIDEDKDFKCDICGAPLEHKISTSVKGDPAAPFYLKVGETKAIKATLDPTPDAAEQKTFSWYNSNRSKASLTIDPNDSSKGTVTGLQAGNVIFTATNDYNKNLKREFNATVIDYDQDNMYLWEYAKDDKDQFGYSSTNKAGNKSGNARLGDLTWAFERSKVSSLNLTGSGAIGFGKEDDPETIVSFVNKNKRQVKKIAIETWSAQGLANLKIDVGDTNVLNKKTNKNCETITTEDLEDLEGDISITYTTPSFDPERADDETYQHPGCFYIKSIWITYAEVHYDYVTEKTFDFEAMYADKDNNEFKALTSTAKSLTIEDEKLSVNFNKIKKADDKILDHALTNSDIVVKIKDTSEVIKYVEFKYKIGSTSNTYTISSSMFGNEPYLNLVTSGKENLSGFVSEENANVIKLSPSGTANVGLISLTVKTIAGEHAVIKEVKFPEGAKPSKTSYITGETFNPYGLENLIVSFTNSEIEDVIIPLSALTFYDGVSYDASPDHSGKTTVLAEGTTYVVTEFNGFTLKVEGITVATKNITLNKVVGEFEEGSYLIVSKANNVFLKGSSKADDFRGTGGVGNLISSDDTTVVISSLNKNDLLTFEQDGDFFTIKNSNGSYFGLTEKGNISLAAKPAFTKWAITIDDQGIATMQIIGKDDAVYYYGFTGSKFEVKDANPANLSLYKIAE